MRVALEEANGSVTRAAKTLLVTPRALQLRRAVTRMLPMSMTAPREASAASEQ